MLRTNIIYTFIIALLILIGSGCVSSSVTKLATKDYQPVRPENVRIIMDANELPEDFEKVALIKTKQNYNFKDKRAHKKARKKAGELGANGIILKGMDEPGTGGKITSAVFGVGGQTEGNMVAIYVPEWDN